MTPSVTEAPYEAVAAMTMAKGSPIANRGQLYQHLAVEQGEFDQDYCKLRTS